MNFRFSIADFRLLSRIIRMGRITQIIRAICFIRVIRDFKSQIANRKSKISVFYGSGFTLIELMVATVITIMIIGSVYAAFRSSLDVYQRDETRIVMLQRCRVALDRIARDLSNLFFIEGDEEMQLLVDDFADSETTMDKDMISFVAIVKPRLDDYVAAEEESAGTASLDEGEENPLPSDLSRIIYYVGPSPEDANVQSLMRIETTNLDTEELEDMMKDLMSSSPSEEVQEELQPSILVDYIAGLNIRYFDGTDWADTWDAEEEGGIPSAVELTLSITDADKQETTLTQAVVVYLPMSEPSTEGTGLQQVGGTGAQR